MFANERETELLYSLDLQICKQDVSIKYFKDWPQLLDDTLVSVYSI